MMGKNLAHDGGIIPALIRTIPKMAVPTQTNSGFSEPVGFWLGVEFDIGFIARVGRSRKFTGCGGPLHCYLNTSS